MPNYAAALGVAYLLNQNRRDQRGGTLYLPEPDEPLAVAPAAGPAAAPTAEEIEEGRGIAPVPVWRLFTVIGRRPRLRVTSGSS
jgi:hypothetical protein